MRNRKKQQELIKAKVSKEEQIDLMNGYGIKDPTPYEAMKNMIRKEGHLPYLQERARGPDTG